MYAGNGMRLTGHQLPSQVANLKGMELGENISSRSQGTTSPALSHPSYPSTPGSDENRIPPDLPTGMELPRGPVDMARQPSAGSVAATVGTEYSPHPNAGPLENGFPFPNGESLVIAICMLTRQSDLFTLRTRLRRKGSA